MVFIVYISIRLWRRFMILVAIGSCFSRLCEARYKANSIVASEHWEVRHIG